MRTFILAAALLFAATPALAAPKTIVGPATANDGDTITINGVPIYLYHIDAPELGQRCVDQSGEPFDGGAVARDKLAKLVASGPVKCLYVVENVRGKAKVVANETIVFPQLEQNTGMCTSASGENLSLEMIRTGWVYFQIHNAAAFGLPHNGLIRMKKEHRKNNRGLYNAGVGALPKCGNPRLEANRQDDPRP